MDIMAQRPKRLFIVDDSKMMRGVIADIFADDEEIIVVGEAADGREALQLLPHVDADVVTLDVQMPVMDGLTTLKHMMIQVPTPTVMLSSYTRGGSSVTFDSLKYGAVDFVTKPSNAGDLDFTEQTREIIKKVHQAAEVEIEAVRFIRAVRKNGNGKKINPVDCRTIVAIGAAEGGYGSLLKLAPHLSPDHTAAYLVMLYEPPRHVDAFVNYLDDHCAIQVKRAADNDLIEGGICYLASGEEYLTVDERDGFEIMHLCPAPFSSLKGSINMMMFSISELKQEHSLGIILSGMGHDGIEGLEEIVRAGGSAFVQDLKGCLYKEMPGAALERCESARVVSDSKMAAAIHELMEDQQPIMEDQQPT